MLKTLFILIVLLLNLSTFAQPDKPTLTHLDTLFIINADETITALYRPSFTGETFEETTITLDFSVGGEVMDVQLADSAIFERLDHATLNIPPYIPKPCDLSPTIVRGHGPGYSPYLMIPAESADFTVTDEQVSVAFRLEARQLNEDELEPDLYGTVLHQAPAVQITYRASDVKLAIAAPKTNVYVIATTFYTAENAVEADLSTLRYGINEVAMTLRDTFEGPTSDTPQDQFERLLNSEARPVLQYTGGLNEDLAPLFDEQTFLSRLRVTSADTVFIPTSQIMNTDFTQAIDPVYYYGCTTENLYNPDFEAQLPANHVYVEALRAYVPLLDGWKFFDFENEFTAAPENLTDDEALRHGRGYASQITVPALGFVLFRVPFETEAFEAYPDISRDPLARLDLANVQTVATGNSYLWYWPHSETAPAEEGDEAYAHGVKIRMVAPLEDYAANTETYDNLLRWFSMYQYFTHPDLRHTLFLGSLYSHIEIGYPEGWAMSFHAEGSRSIMPIGGEVDDVRVEIIPIERDNLDTFARERYNLSAAALADTDTAPIAYQAHTRYGFIRLAEFNGRSHLIVFSAPELQRSEWEDMLSVMASAMRQNP